MNRPTRELTPEQKACVARRLELRAKLEAIVDGPDWALILDCLRTHRRRLMESLAANGRLTDQEMRDHQARYVLLASLIDHPVAYLSQCDIEEGHKG